MATEIERKFWIKMDPVGLENKFKNYKNQLIIQSYINKEDDFYEIRIREYEDGRHYLEFKSRGDLMREEFGIKLTDEQYKTLFENVKKTIRKRRYYLDSGNVFLDIYLDDLFGFVTLEIEGDMELIGDYQLSKNWIGEEVTYNDKFKNRNVAFGIPMSGKELEILRKTSNRLLSKTPTSLRKIF